MTTPHEEERHTAAVLDRLVRTYATAMKLRHECEGRVEIHASVDVLESWKALGARTVDHLGAAPTVWGFPLVEIRRGLTDLVQVHSITRVP